MSNKVDYMICSVPIRIDICCPNCEEELSFDFDDLKNEFGVNVYYGNCGKVECHECKTEFELGDCEYD